MSAAIAHELTQPLTAILANAQAAQRLLTVKPVNLDQLKEALADICQEDLRAADVISHLRQIMKPRGEMEFPELDLNGAVESALHILGPEAQKRGVALSANLLHGALPVRCDQIYLEQVIINLMMNGMDAMESLPSGKRQMEVKSTLVGKGEVEVSIYDSGTGIPDITLQDIFEPFYTTKQQGAGLGLSISRTIVETFGGKIWAESRSGGGAVFRFTLPLAKVH
jgi:C4-dicarboxylate-specific signal transduction histidine kinase